MAGATTVKKTKVVITGSDDSGDPMNSIKKLLAGFCDPARPEEDEASLDFQSRELPTDKSPLQQYAEGGQTYGVEASVGSKVSPPETMPEAEAGTDATEEPESIEVAAEDFELKKGEPEIRPEPPVLKASHTGSEARFMRGFGVTMFAMLAVVATLLILNHLGYEVDLKVVETKILSEHQKLINFVSNDKVDSASDKGANGKYDEVKKEDTTEETIEPVAEETPPEVEQVPEVEEEAQEDVSAPEEAIEVEEPEPPEVDKSYDGDDSNESSQEPVETNEGYEL